MPRFIWVRRAAQRWLEIGDAASSWIMKTSILGHTDLLLWSSGEAEVCRISTWRLHYIIINYLDVSESQTRRCMCIFYIFIEDHLASDSMSVWGHPAMGVWCGWVAGPGNIYSYLSYWWCVVLANNDAAASCRDNIRHLHISYTDTDTDTPAV